MGSHADASAACYLFSFLEVLPMFGVNPYSPYGYPAPFGNQGPQSPMSQTQFMQQPQQQPQQSQAGGPDWIQVPTIKQVEQVQVPTGGKAWVMVQNEPVFALRTADNMGLVTTDYYRFEKIDPAVTTPAPSADYITRAEFEQFVSSLKADRKDGDPA